MAFSAYRVGLVALAALASLAVAQNAAGGPVSFVTPIAPSTTAPVRITFMGSNFSEFTAFRLSSNATACDVSTEFSQGEVPPFTWSNIVRWTKHDPSNFMVVDFRINFPAVTAYVCATRDEKRWFRATNSRGRSHLHIWHKTPTITVMAPETPVANQPLYLKVPHLHRFTHGALVRSRDGCDGDRPQNVLNGANMSTYDWQTEMFGFHPVETAPQVFLCVSSGPLHTDWSLIPFDPKAIVQPRFTPSQPLGPNREKYGREIYFEVYAAATRWSMGHISCTPIVAGSETTCTLYVQNTTLVPLAAGEITLADIRDGGGVTDCPLPVVQHVDGSTTHVYFKWTPQREGRGGRVSFYRNGKPLFLHNNPLNDEWFKLPNRTKQLPPHSQIDLWFTRFIVLPGFHDLQTYPYENLINFAYFGPTANWKFIQENHTAHQVTSATIDDGVISATLSKATAIPAGSTMCRMRVLYQYSADNLDGPDETQSAYIGYVKFQRDAVTLHTFNLYASGTRVIVTGGPRTIGMDGDMRRWESIGVEIPVDATHSTITVALEAYHGNVKRTWFSDVSMRCSSAVATTAPEVAALQRIWNSVGSSSTTINTWKDGANFRGDPCLNHWHGVTCRHMRVVELDLTTSELTGLFPQIPELSRLEKLIIKDNALTGQMPTHLANLTRLRYFDASNNQFYGVPDAAFNANTHVCLRVFKARHNLITKYPTQLAWMPQLEQLDLANNRIADTVHHWPSFDAPLVHLDLSNNHLCGSLPHLPVFAPVSIDFSSNRFNGTIPTQWGELQRLELLDVSKNELSGPIPLELSKIQSGSRLTFRGEENFFRGLLPNLNFLRVDVRDNIFKCPLPKEHPWILTSHIGGMDILECDYHQED